MADVLLKRLEISREECREIMRNVIKDMDLDIAKKPCCLNMINSYVAKLPTGKEQGRYMAIDIGGTNMRVQMFECSTSCLMLESQKFVMTDQIKNSDKDTLFNYIADCTKEFLTSFGGIKDASTPMRLGFTFSYPVKQLALRSGLLVQWTKEMNVEGVVGGDVVAMLEEALLRKGLNLHVVALVNDTVGTLVSSAFDDQDTFIGLINGTGSNLCYMDFKQKIIYNVEFGSYGSGVGRCLDAYLTEADALVDHESINPGKQIIEKTISGKYMGEVLRKVLLLMTDYGRIFKGWQRGVGGGEAADGGGMKIMQQYSLDTEMMGVIESEPSTSTKETRRVLECLGVHGAVEEDLKQTQVLCKLVSARAAKLLGAGIAAAILKVDKPKVTVAYDGSVMKSYPGFSQFLLSEINQNLEGKVQVSLRESEDGSGRGAALVAASNHYEG